MVTSPLAEMYDFSFMKSFKTFPELFDILCGKKVRNEKIVDFKENTFGNVYWNFIENILLLLVKKYYTEPPSIKKIFDWNSCLLFFALACNAKRFAIVIFLLFLIPSSVFGRTGKNF